MSYLNRHVDAGFDRLQRLLLAMHPGDSLRVREASNRTGLTESTCRTVLEGLEQAGLMDHDESDLYVRRRLNLLAS